MSELKHRDTETQSETRTKAAKATKAVERPRIIQPLRLVRVKDQLPDDEMAVLCCNPLSEDWEIGIHLGGQWYKLIRQGEAQSTLELIVWEVTHWMDLPTYEHI